MDFSHLMMRLTATASGRFHTLANADASEQTEPSRKSTNESTPNAEILEAIHDFALHSQWFTPKKDSHFPHIFGSI